MNFFFTYEDEAGRAATRQIRASLWRRGHGVAISHEPRPPEATQVWFFGSASTRPRSEMSQATRTALENFAGDVVFLQTDDGLDFKTEAVPETLRQRARLFLRNHWRADHARIPAEIRERMGYLPPFLIRGRQQFKGPAYARRRPQAFFIGNRTGAETNNPREQMVRLVRSARLPFFGGIFSYPGDPAPPAGLATPKLSGHDYLRELRNSQICLAPWGNCPLTYRLFEGLAAGNLVIAQSLADVDFVSCGLAAGTHYVEVRADLSDLVEKLSHFLERPEAAERIAAAGQEHFFRHLVTRHFNLTDSLFDAVTGSWLGLLPDSESFPLAARQWRTVASLFRPFR